MVFFYFFFCKLLFSLLKSGPYSVGKSMFINAIIGDNILPNSALEQTKNFYVIKHNIEPVT